MKRGSWTHHCTWRFANGRNDNRVRQHNKEPKRTIRSSTTALTTWVFCHRVLSFPIKRFVAGRIKRVGQVARDARYLFLDNRSKERSVPSPVFPAHVSSFETDWRRKKREWEEDEEWVQFAHWFASLPGTKERCGTHGFVCAVADTWIRKAI